MFSQIMKIIIYLNVYSQSLRKGGENETKIKNLKLYSNVLM